jgi:hypothetical protein
MKKKRNINVTARKTAGQSNKSTESVKVLRADQTSTLTEHPLPTLTLCDEATNHRCEIVTPSQRERVHSHICASLMREVNVRDRDLR